VTTTRPWWLLPAGRIHAMWWMAVGCAMLWIDHVASTAEHFPAVYIIPVILAAWYSGKRDALRRSDELTWRT